MTRRPAARPILSPRRCGPHRVPVAGRPARVELDIRAPQQNPLPGVTVGSVAGTRPAGFLRSKWRCYTGADERKLLDRPYSAVL